MFKSLYFKIILIFVIFMVTAMAVVGTVLLTGVYNYYLNDFKSQMTDAFIRETELKNDLILALADENYVDKQKAILNAYSGVLGIDVYRNFFVLDENGSFLDGSDVDLGNSLNKTENLVKAINGSDGTEVVFGANYADFAIFLESDENSNIIYIKDSMQEMHNLSWQLFIIILQALIIGIVISVVLSFFLSRAIASPIARLTRGAQLIATGEFSESIAVESKDEIGTLTKTFNNMKSVLKSTLDEISGERQKLETVFLYLKDAVVAFSESGEVVHINKSAIILFGNKYSDKFTFDKMLELFKLSFAKKSILDLNTSLYKNNENSYIARDVEFLDKHLDLNFGAFRYVEDNESHRGVIAVIHDMTGRYELEKSRKEFVANVSHELRTPLTVIKGATETVLSYPEMPDEMKLSFLNNVIDESNRMLRIVMDLLTLSRLDNNKTQWQIKTYDFEESVKHICNTMTYEASERNHTLTYHSKGNVPEVTADKEKIEQVLINIISNAIKYTPCGGKIDVYLDSAQNDSVVVRIVDNGVGIPDEDKDRLFERFYRVEKSRTTDTGGTGLGLAIAKEIVTAHGGTISFTSVLKEGTEFRIELPCHSLLEFTKQYE